MDRCHRFPVELSFWIYLVEPLFFQTDLLYAQVFQETYIHTHIKGLSRDLEIGCQEIAIENLERLLLH